MTQALAVAAIYISLVIIYFWRLRIEKRRELAEQEMSDHRVQLRERKANEELWNLLEKDDPQFLKDMGIEMPDMQVYELERQFRMLQQAPPGTMIPVSRQQLQGLGTFAYLGKHAQQAQQQQRLLSQMFDQ